MTADFDRKFNDSYLRMIDHYSLQIQVHYGKHYKKLVVHDS